MLVLPWRLGEPSLASASPEDFIRDVLGPRMLAAEPRRGGRRRQIVLDVGANTGQFSMSVQRASLDGIAFEPEPTTCEALKRNVERDRSAQGFAGRYGSVTVHCAAVGSQMGSVTIRTRGPNRSATLQTVKQVSLDDVLELVPGAPVYRQRILLLKSDTQGYELDVLFGATNILMRHAARLLLLELSHKLLHDAGASPLQLLNEVSNAGYDCTMLALWGPKLSPSTGMVEFTQLPFARRVFVQGEWRDKLWRAQRTARAHKAGAVAEWHRLDRFVVLAGGAIVGIECIVYYSLGSTSTLRPYLTHTRPSRASARPER